MPFLQLQPQSLAATAQTSLPLRSLFPCHFCSSSPSHSPRPLKPRSPSVASSHAISAAPAPVILSDRSRLAHTSLPLRSLFPCHFCSSSPSHSQRPLKPRSSRKTPKREPKHLRDAFGKKCARFGEWDQLEREFKIKKYSSCHRNYLFQILSCQTISLFILSQELSFSDIVLPDHKFIHRVTGNMLFRYCLARP